MKGGCRARSGGMSGSVVLEGVAMLSLHLLSGFVVGGAAPGVGGAVRLPEGGEYIECVKLLGDIKLGDISVDDR